MPWSEAFVSYVYVVSGMCRDGLSCLLRAILIIWEFQIGRTSKPTKITAIHIYFFQSFSHHAWATTTLLNLLYLQSCDTIETKPNWTVDTVNLCVRLSYCPLYAYFIRFHCARRTWLNYTRSRTNKYI